MEENFDENLRIVDKITEVAKRRHCTPAQLALSWILARAPHIIPIFGTTNLKRLEQNLRALHIELTPEELEEIDSISPKGIAKGHRYPEYARAFLDG
jgi:aryl-alcohol dehydrogenase-like predicted oxidoreductase